MKKIITSQKKSNIKKSTEVRVTKIVHELKLHTKKFDQPLIDQVIQEYGKDPFLILIACLLSARAKDSTTIHVVRDLFKRATAKHAAKRPTGKQGVATQDVATQGVATQGVATQGVAAQYVATPQDMLKISRSDLEKIVFRSGFYKNKAKAIHQASKTIIEKFGGTVPSTYQDLISINGVGPKTANLVLGMAFGKPAICVDTHVHRISNRLGIIKTKTAEQTQIALEAILPQTYWISWNKLLVMWGQNICLPRGPKCEICAINKLCDRVGVKKL